MTISVARLVSGRESRSETGRQRSEENLESRQATERATKETISTSDAPHANSQTGIGRSWRPITSPCASGQERVRHGVTFSSATCTSLPSSAPPWR